MRLKAIHFEWSIVTVEIQRKHSGDNHEKVSPEDADVKPPRVLPLILGGLVFQGTIRLSQGGLAQIQMGS